MDASLIVQLASAAGLASVIGAMVNGFLNRRKLGAEATNIISQAAGGMVERLEKENVRLSAENAEFRTKFLRIEDQVRRRDRRDERMKQVLNRHIEIDKMLIAKLGELGVHIDPIEPITWLEDDEDDLFG